MSVTSTDQLVEDYRASHPGSAELHQRASDFFAARGATHFARVSAPFRPYITHALDARKWDVDGNEYIDYVMGHGALILGHGHPAILEAVQQQLVRGVHFGDNHALEVEWAGLIRGLMPAAERIEFFACGQEANLMGIRLGRLFTGRRQLLRFRWNYHGWADELAGPLAAGTVADQVTLIPPNDLDLLEEHLSRREYAVLLIEGGGGYLAGRVPIAAEFYQALPELTRKYGTVLLLDEVVTGFREAPGGWQSVVGIEPDLTSIGKAVSGGLPAGGLLGRAALFEALNPNNARDRLVVHGGTWNALPLTCAAGIAACRLYQDGSPQRAALKMAERLKALGNDVLQRRGVTGRLYGRSAVHLGFGAEGQETSPETLQAHRRLDLHLLHRGVSTLLGEVFVLSSAHSRADVDQTVSAFDQSIGAMLEEGTLCR
ncbi:MAG TPA: aminotransferase class III-fold pyridoxal phosphate-dependent enzyme [Gemmatimonadales bacterium]